MPSEYTTTLYEEKPIAKSKISIASWSPKMDMIAIGSPSGIVSLHRQVAISFLSNFDMQFS